MSWTEVSNLERKIILSIHKNPKSITEVSKEINRTKSTISITVKRLIKQEIIKKSQEYIKDARKIELSINSKRVKIRKAHIFYLNYYILISTFLVFSGIIWAVIKNFLIFLGSIIIAIPILLMMFYQVYAMENEVIVEKNPKIIKKELKQEQIEEPEIS